MITFFSCVTEKKRCAITILCLLFFCCLCAFPASARQPLRIIYVEADLLDEYRQTLQGLAHTLHLADRLTAQPPVLTSADGSRTLWSWLGKHTDGKLWFWEDGFYSAQWVDNALNDMRQAVQRRLGTRGGDVDVILALGTRAGKIMAGLPTPRVFCSASLKKYGRVPCRSSFGALPCLPSTCEGHLPGREPFYGSHLECGSIL